MYTLNCKGRLLKVDKPVIMGILNATPDSFFPGSRLDSVDAALFKAEQMIREGAKILDIGGQSTRPQSAYLEADEEAGRVIPVIEAVNRRFPDQIISVDTFYGKVAREAVAAGACIVNDVSAGNLDEDLFPAVSQLQVPYVLMHMPGTPQTMQQHAVYKNVTLEVFDFLNFKIQQLTAAGIKDIIIDPGFGFGKTFRHNFQLLHNLSYFLQLEKPVLIGLSRKATIYKTLEVSAEEALNGTTVANTFALINGASILRVHDVKEAFEVIKLFNAYTSSIE